MEVLEGKRLVHAHCYRADEILMLLRVADDYGFKIRTLQHVLEGYKVAKEIAAHGAGASTFSDWWAYKVEAFDAIPYNAAIMMRKGVLVSLNSDSDELMRHLNDEAAKTMKYGGLIETEALSPGHHQSGQTTGDRQSRGIHRSGQRRRPGASSTSIRFRITPRWRRSLSTGNCISIARATWPSGPSKRRRRKS